MYNIPKFSEFVTENTSSVALPKAAPDNSIVNIGGYTGRRPRAIVKTVFEPIIKALHKEMKKLGGKLTPDHYYWVFKTPEAMEHAIPVSTQILEQWKEAEKAFPEGNMGAAIANEYFKRQEARPKNQTW